MLYYNYRKGNKQKILEDKEMLELMDFAGLEDLLEEYGISREEFEES